MRKTKRQMPKEGECAPLHVERKPCQLQLLWDIYILVRYASPKVENVKRNYSKRKDCDQSDSKHQRTNK